MKTPIDGTMGEEIDLPAETEPLRPSKIAHLCAGQAIIITDMTTATDIEMIDNFRTLVGFLKKETFAIDHLHLTPEIIMITGEIVMKEKDEQGHLKDNTREKDRARGIEKSGQLHKVHALKKGVVSAVVDINMRPKIALHMEQPRWQTPIATAAKRELI